MTEENKNFLAEAMKELGFSAEDLKKARKHLDWLIELEEADL